MDVVSAYLAGTLDEEIYMDAPEGLGHQRGTVVRLIKSIYGLKQSGRVWYKKIEKTLNSYRLAHTESDWSVFTNNGHTIILGIYVDDLIITGPDLAEIKALKAAISSVYPVKDLGQIKVCLGLNIERTETGMTIDQVQYIEDMLQAYRMENCAPVSSPMDGYDGTLPATPEEPLADALLYQQAIGSLQYCAIGTRMDISYALGRLSQHLATPTIRHWNAVLRIFRYLKGTLHYKLSFGPHGILQIQGFADADYASGGDRVSISAYVFTFNGAAIAWSSKRQRTISTSTVEAEYIALCAGAKQAVWLRELFIELGQDKYLSEGPGNPVQIFGDNQGALALVGNPENHQRTKHIDVQYHYIRHLVNTGKVEISYCPTDKMAADALTKPLARTKLSRCLQITFGLLDAE
jgi:hypothetical protein